MGKMNPLGDSDFNHIDHSSCAATYVLYVHTSRRRVEWRRLTVALDVVAPADLTDPDSSFLDKLPQPYRLIVSVLDTEVHIQRMWCQNISVLSGDPPVSLQRMNYTQQLHVRILLWAICQAREAKVAFGVL